MKLAKEDFEQYIIPINGAREGTGVLVGNLFIIAGHVVAGFSNPSVFIFNNTYSLTSENRIFASDNPTNSTTGFDLALYRLEGVNSPLELAADLPEKDTELISLSRHTIITRTSESIFGIQEDRIIECLTGKVIEYYGNYFECHMDSELSVGRSGSPLLEDNKVVGILCGDKDNKARSNTVLFLSSKAIVGLLKQQV